MKNTNRHMAALFGFLTLPEVKSILQQEHYGPSRGQDAEKLWQKYFAARSGLPLWKPGLDKVTKISEGTEVLERIKHSRNFKRYVKALNSAAFVMVPVDSLLTPQWEIDLDYVEELSKKISPSSSLEEQLVFAMTDNPVREPVIYGDAIEFSSPHRDLCVSAPEVRCNENGEYEIVTRVHSEINFIQVIEAQGRLLVKNGTHKACAFYKAGLKYCPCLLMKQDNIEGDINPAINGSHMEREVYTSSRPALVIDFLNPNAAVPLEMFPGRQFLKITTKTEKSQRLFLPVVSAYLIGEKKYGISAGEASGLLQKIKTGYENYHSQHPQNYASGYSYFTYHPEHVFYLNSSDPVLAEYDAVSVVGQRVLTVGGSGEFGQIFTAKGADRVDIIDYSLPACFWNELKFTAARALSYEDYCRMFDVVNMSKPSVFDTEAYRQLQEHLSLQARSFFDTLQLPEFSEFFRVDLNAPVPIRGHYNFGMARFRDGNRSRFVESRFIQESPVLLSPERYDDLRNAARKISWNIVQGDIASYKSDLSLYDLVYTSNATYDSIIQNAYNILLCGAGRVGFTVRRGDWPAGSGQLLSEEVRKTEESLTGRRMAMARVTHVPVAMPIGHGRVLKATLLAVDAEKNYGYYFEARSQDNI